MYFKAYNSVRCSRYTRRASGRTNIFHNLMTCAVAWIVYLKLPIVLLLRCFQSVYILVYILFFFLLIMVDIFLFCIYSPSIVKSGIFFFCSSLCGAIEYKARVLECVCINSPWRLEERGEPKINDHMLVALNSYTENINSFRNIKILMYSRCC